MAADEFKPVKGTLAGVNLKTHHGAFVRLGAAIERLTLADRSA